jgi:hypothetical protein
MHVRKDSAMDSSASNSFPHKVIQLGPTRVPLAYLRLCVMRQAVIAGTSDDPPDENTTDEVGRISLSSDVCSFRVSQQIFNGI